MTQHAGYVLLIAESNTLGQVPVVWWRRPVEPSGRNGTAVLAVTKLVRPGTVG